VRAVPARPGCPAGRALPAAGRAASALRAAIPHAPGHVVAGQPGGCRLDPADARLDAGELVVVDLTNSFHLHRNCFDYIPPGTDGFTDTVRLR
jgi:hypothetical protein